MQCYETNPFFVPAHYLVIIVQTFVHTVVKEPLRECLLWNLLAQRPLIKTLWFVWCLFEDR